MHHTSRFLTCLLALLAIPALAADPPTGFEPIFDGKTMDGWHARPHFSPIELAAMEEDARQAKMDQWMAT